jgi:hypothetical protein
VPGIAGVFAFELIDEAGGLRHREGSRVLGF